MQSFSGYSAGDAFCDVLIVGAGMAGLAAARALAERGLRVTVLEARKRVGGRVFSQTVQEGVVVELGAEFVHGRPPELWALIDECGAHTTERDGVMLREEPDGALAEDDMDSDEVFTPLEQLKDFSGPDLPFSNWLAGSNIPAEEHQAILGYVEGFNAADAQIIGVRSLGAQQKAEDETAGDRAWHVQGGYAQLAEYLAQRTTELGGTVRLGCEVRSIRWAAGKVEIRTAEAGLTNQNQGLATETFHAPRCIVTLPLGILQRANTAGGLQMQPEPAALAAARRLAMGHVVRFTMVFRERWWERSPRLHRDKLRNMSFLFTTSRLPPVWWTPHPEVESLPTLTGWVGGPRAQALAGKSASELGREACVSLSQVFDMDEDVVQSSLLTTLTHNWTSDPHSVGAYSYVPAGALDAPAIMAQPELNTLFFAGEHTDITGNWGTVHAALRSGLQAAEQVLGEL